MAAIYSTSMAAASSLRMDNSYPRTVSSTGSPSGATLRTETVHLGDPHIHDSTFGCAFTMEPNHSHRLTRSDISESFHTLFLLHHDSVSQVVIKGDP